MELQRLIGVIWVLSITTGFAAYSSWDNGSPVLPRDLTSGPTGAAVCYDDEPSSESIWFIGLGNAWMSFDLSSTTFTDYGDTLATQIYPAAGQYYSQLGNTLYLVEGYNHDDQLIHSFDVKAHTMTYSLTQAPAAVSGVSNQCMASFSSDSDYLIVAGGDDASDVYHNYVEIYDITNDVWLSNVPDMQQARNRHSCVVVDQRVYAIGGGDTQNAPVGTTWEVLNLVDMANIQSESWSVMATALSWEKDQFSAVVYGSDILLLGGSPYEDDATRKIVVVIDTITGAIDSASGPLIYGADSMSGIHAFGKLYTFGGTYFNPTTGTSTATTEWQSHTLPTNVWPMHTYDKPMNVYPSTSEQIVSRLFIKSTQEATTGSVTSYYAKFNILGEDCWWPQLWVQDFSGKAPESLNVSFIENGADRLLQECASSVDSCGATAYSSCFWTWELTTEPIPAGTQVVFRIDRGPSVNPSDACDYTFDAQLNFICGQVPVFSDYTSWSAGSGSLPWTSGTTAVYYDDEPGSETIYISDRYRFMTFDPDTSSFTDLGWVAANSNADTVYNYGQYWSQLGNEVYMIGQGAIVYSFDIKSQIFAETSSSYPQISTIVENQCVASVSSDSDYLVVAGGCDASSTCYSNAEIYDITNDVWLSNVPDMQLNRGSWGFACVVVDQKVYAIAGSDLPNTGDAAKKVEYLDISNMTDVANQAWTLMSDTILPFRQGLRAVVYSTDIVVIGGSEWEAYDLVIDVIDTVTHTITSGGPLVYGTRAMASIYVYPNIYTFGGSRYTTEWEDELQWQFHSVASSINNYDKPINIYPSLSGPIQATINIRSTRPEGTYYAKFNVLNENCHNPTVTVDGLMGGTPDSLNVYYESSLLADCASSITGCASSGTCLTDQLLDDNFFVPGSQIVIRIERVDTTPGDCADLSFAADITLTCTAVPVIAPSNCIAVTDADVSIVAGVSSQGIYSPNGEVQFYVQNDGNVCGYTIDGAYKLPRVCTETEAQDGTVSGYLYSLNIQTDGNMTVRDGSDVLKWTSNTAGVAPLSFCVEDCGLAILRGSDRRTVWQSDYTTNVGVGDYPSCATTFESNCVDVTDADVSIVAGDGKRLYSPDGQVGFWIQTDGNVCLYTWSGDSSLVRYCTETQTVDGSGYSFNIGTDGNMSVRDESDVLQWTSNTAGVAPLSFCVDDCGLATLSGADGRAVWQSDYTSNSGVDDYPYCPIILDSNCVDVTDTYDVSIVAGDSKALYSPDGEVQFWIQDDGRVCLYTGQGDSKVNRFCTDTLTADGSGYSFNIGTDGNMSVRDASDVLKWTSNTAGVAPLSFCVEDCGLATLRGADRRTVWQSDYTTNVGVGDYPSCPTTFESNCVDVTDADLSIVAGDGKALYSPDGLVSLWIQNDGNVCLYTWYGDSGVVRYCTMTQTLDGSGYSFNIGTDGNMSVRDASDVLQWTSNTAGVAPLSFCVEDCGLATLRGADRRTVWQSDYTTNTGLDDYPSCATTFESNCVDVTDVDVSIVAGDGKRLYSPDGQVGFWIQTDGNVCLYTWSGDSSLVRYCTETQTVDGSGYSFNIGTDGNMSVRDASDVLQWTSNTAGVAPLSFCIDDCGLATLSGADGRTVWQSDYTSNTGLDDYPYCPIILDPNCVDVTDTYDVSIVAGDGKALYSPDGEVQFWIQDDGNVCLYTGQGDSKIARYCTETQTVDGSGYSFNIGTDGNMSVRDGSDVLQWTSNTAGVAPFSFCVEDCGFATLSGSDGRPVWQSEYTVNADLDEYPDCPTILDSNCLNLDLGGVDYLAFDVDMAIYSPDGQVQFWIQDDGNVCLYTGSGDSKVNRFCTGTVTADASSYAFSFQKNGDMEVRDNSDDTIKWSAGSSGVGPFTFCVQDCGLATLRDVDGVALWQSEYDTNVGVGDYPTCPAEPTSAPTEPPVIATTEEVAIDTTVVDSPAGASTLTVLYAQMALVLAFVFVCK